MNRTILIVEDNRDDAELAMLALVAAAPDWIRVVRDGAEALAYLLGDGDLPSVVLLDVKLPKVDGFEVLGRVRSEARTRSLPVVMLTSSDMPEDIARAYALGANSYVRKPIAFGEYRDAVARVGAYWLDINVRPP